MSDQSAKMHTGELYLPDDEEIVAEQTARLDRLYDFNQTRSTEFSQREAMLRDMFAEIGDDTMIGPNVTLATAGHPILP